MNPNKPKGRRFRMNKIKFSAFADLHHDMEWCGDGEERLDFILDRAKKENVDFIIHLGDMTHEATAMKETLDKYNNFEIPTYHVLGNHDMDRCTLEDVVKAYNMPHEYYYFDKNGFRFIVLNANYIRIDGKDIPYSMGNYFQHGKDREWVSQEQIEWLEEVVMSSPYPMVLFSHGSLVREDVTQAALKNREEIQNIIRKAHANGKRIFMCINGHHHIDYLRILDNVVYLDLNSTTFNTVSKKHDYFPRELCEKYTSIKFLVLFNDPIHAVIELDGNTVTINGMESSFFMGVTPELVGDPIIDGSGRRQTPKVQSAKITLL